jgi:hypothetical protein
VIDSLTLAIALLAPADRAGEVSIPSIKGGTEIAFHRTVEIRKPDAVASIQTREPIKVKPVTGFFLTSN